MGLMKDLDGLNAVYASMHENGPMVLTKADKMGNTPAWRNRHKKSVKTGEPIYKMADHLKDEYEAELWDIVAENLTELHHLSEEGIKWKVSPLNEKESYKTVAAVIDYDRSKKGTDDATYDSEHGEKKKAKKERDYAAWEREKMKKDDPNWEHKKGSTSESMQHRRNPEGSIKDRFKSRQTDPSKDNFTGISDNIETIMKQNAAMKKAAAKKTKKEELELTGKFTEQEIAAILEAERTIASRLERKRKLYDKTTKKAMDDAMRTGEASGHNRYRMGSINREYEALKAKRDKKEK